MNRREVLRLMGVGAAAALGSACQVPAPRASEATPGLPTLAPTTVPTPTLAPTAVAASPGIRFAIDIDPDTLDPAGQTHPTIQSVVDYMAETLVRVQPDGAIAPGLASKWDVSADGRVYTFELRPNVRFHDGALLTSEAVKHSFERFLNQELRVPLRAPFDIVTAIVPLDPLTFRIYLKESSRLFLHKLAGTEMAIVSPAHARAFPATYNEEPIGSGPYRFKERRKGESVLLERFEGYWGKRPHYPHVQFRIVPEVATR